MNNNDEEDEDGPNEVGDGEIAVGGESVAEATTNQEPSWGCHR